MRIALSVILINFLLWTFPALAGSAHQLQNLVASSAGKRALLIQDFLPLLPKFYRENYILIYGSFSPQFGDQIYPRTLLFSEDHSLALAFTGSPEAMGEEVIEIIEKINSGDTGRPQYVFHQIVFPGERPWQAPRGRALTPRFEKDIGKRDNCIGCHGTSITEPLPITGFEPGGGLIPLYFGVAARFPHRKPYRALSDTDELIALKEFVTLARTHPRYSQLKGLQFPSEITPESLSELSKKLHQKAQGLFQKFLSN